MKSDLEYLLAAISSRWDNGLDLDRYTPVTWGHVLSIMEDAQKRKRADIEKDQDKHLPHNNTR